MFEGKSMLKRYGSSKVPQQCMSHCQKSPENSFDTSAPLCIRVPYSLVGNAECVQKEYQARCSLDAICQWKGSVTVAIPILVMYSES